MTEDLLLNSQEFQKILKEIKKGNESHSYLFYSPDEYSAKQMSRLVAKALLCNTMCDKCENCVKFNFEHPDVKYFPKKGQLLVEDSNYIVDESFIKPIFADKKIFIIDDFDKSTLSAQNKLLKVIEEPNKNMYYLLSTSNLENVLPTIRSRCFKVVVGNFSKDVLLKEFKNAESDFLKIAIAIGRGYLGKTINLVNNKNLKDIFLLSRDIICKLKNSKETLIYSKKISSYKEDFNLILEIISLILEDLIAIKTKKKNLLNFDFIEKDLNDVCDEYSMTAIIETEKLLLNIMKELRLFTNQTLIIDNFLVNLLEVKYRCR